MFAMSAFGVRRTTPSSRTQPLHGLTLLTNDLDFGNLLHFPLGSHAGIVVLRLPHEWPAPRRSQFVAEAVSELPPDVDRGCLVIVEPGRMRLRRPS
jgi:hypothetical protein